MPQLQIEQNEVEANAVATPPASNAGSMHSLLNLDAIFQQKLQVLNEEISDMVGVTKQIELEAHRKRLSDLFLRMEGEKLEAYERLEYFRAQLNSFDIETNDFTVDKWQRDGDMVISHCMREPEQDAKLIEAMRRKISGLNEINGKLECLKCENNALIAALKTEKCFNQRNATTLKELATMLTNLTNEDIDINYNAADPMQPNPFCAAIARITARWDAHCAKMYEKTDELKEIETQIRKYEESLAQTHDPGYEHANFKSQIEALQRTILDKDKCIANLNALLVESSQTHEMTRHLCEAKSMQPQITSAEFQNFRVQLDKANSKIDTLMHEIYKNQKQERFLHLETRKLNEQLIELKQKNGDLITNSNRMSSMLKSQEEQRLALAEKNESLLQDYEAEAKKLRAVNVQLNYLQERLTSIEKNRDNLILERNLLRDEVACLKDRDAVLQGRNKSLASQLENTERELAKAHEVIKEQSITMQQNAEKHAEEQKRLQMLTDETKRRLCVVVADYKRLSEEYKKETSCRKKFEKINETFCQWKDAQKTADEEMQTRVKSLEDHISLLLDEKREFLEKYRLLHSVYCNQTNEMDRLRSGDPYGPTTSSGQTDKSFENHLDMIRQAAQRVSQQSSSLRDPSAPLSLAPPPHDPAKRQ